MDSKEILNKLNEINQSIESIKIDLKTKATSVELNDLLTSLAEKDKRISSLESTVASLTEENTKRDERIANLESKFDRFSFLESRCAILENSSKLLERKADDLEQNTRKCNLRISGIDIEVGEYPNSLLQRIKTECRKLDLNLNDVEFDHCHRNGRVDKRGEKPKQVVLLKMRSWSSRNLIYQRRKDFPFKINHDLTTRRQNILSEAIDLIKSPDHADTFEYALADKNCKLKLKSVDGRFHHFSSISELMTLSVKFQLQHKEGEAGDVGGYIKAQEADELFY